MASQIPEIDFPVTVSYDHSVIYMPARLTVLEAVQFKQTFGQLLAQASPPRLITLDFSTTEFIDSSGVGVLVHNFKAAKAKQIDLIFHNVNPLVMGVLSLTSLDKIFTINNPPPTHTESTKTELPLPETHPSVKSWVKRLLDIVGSIIGLGITGLILLPLAIAIKLDSSGPIFFWQTRYGWLGKPFKIIKFRSMCINAEALRQQIPNQAEGAIFKNQNDPRITKVGRFLRRTSLDELPQFWNVLKGEMSLVGTRPPTPDEVDKYDVPQWRRLNVKPGMTGEWQVNGRSKVKNFEDVIQLDLKYQENWSLMYDLKLILKTILILFNKNSGAF